MIYNLGEYDDWEIIKCSVGTSYSGKSLDLTITEMFYEQEDIVYFDSNPLSTGRCYNLKGKIDKFIWINHEIHDFMNVADFKKIIREGTIFMKCIYYGVITLKWQLPGEVAGNNIFNFHKIDRCFAKFRYVNPITEENWDCDILKKLEEEMAAIIVKANRAYREKSEQIGRSKEIHNFLPSSLL